MTVYTSEEQTTATPDLILDARGLEKSYSGKKVVDGLDLQVRKGSVLGLLGPNGAGKTTALRMLYGFITPDAGRIHYEGQDFAAHRGDIKRWLGVCSQDDTLDSDFTVRANLTTFARYFRPKVTNLTERIGQLLRDFGLVPFVNFSPMQLSGGFKKRLLIARSIVHRPKVLFLDEPTTGLDPKARLDVWNLIDDLRRQGLAIILTTHYMDEAERCHRLAFIFRGEVLDIGSPGEIVERRALRIAELTVPERSRRAADLLREQAEVDEVAPFGAILRVAVLGGHDPVALCRRVLAQEDIAVASAEEARPTVEDAFVSMVRSENAQ